MAGKHPGFRQRVQIALHAKVGAQAAATPKVMLADYLAAHPEAAGTDCKKFEMFPVLTKFIDAKNSISIQVHPSNEYALEHEHQYGKTEMWYVLDCEPGAFLYYGFDHEISREELEERIRNNTLTEVLNAVPVKKGDCFFIPSGTLHAICKGVVVVEVQQNSNVTYRGSWFPCLRFGAAGVNELGQNGEHFTRGGGRQTARAACKAGAGGNAPYPAGTA